MQPVGNQGEIRVNRIDALPEVEMRPHAEKIGAAFVISHSEQGNHHVIDGDVEVMERTQDVPAGMRILYAIVKAPTALRQDAATPHKAIPLPPGIYEMRLKREFDPFAEQVRRVAD